MKDRTVKQLIEVARENIKRLEGLPVGLGLPPIGTVGDAIKAIVSLKRTVADLKKIRKMGLRVKTKTLQDCRVIIKRGKYEIAKYYFSDGGRYLISRNNLPFSWANSFEEAIAIIYPVRK